MKADALSAMYAPILTFLHRRVRNAGLQIKTAATKLEMVI
jgi:hypothetical protein